MAYLQLNKNLTEEEVQSIVTFLKALRDKSREKNKLKPGLSGQIFFIKINRNSRFSNDCMFLLKFL
jgi:cytochrome c1